MRRVLVPLDGSALAESILPDARQVAGPDGELILIRNAAGVRDGGVGTVYDTSVADRLEAYLDQQARLLRGQAVQVRVAPTFIGDVAVAIDEAASIFHADLIACATHGRSPLGRLILGSVADGLIHRLSCPIIVVPAHAAGVLQQHDEASERVTASRKEDPI